MFERQEAERQGKRAIGQSRTVIEKERTGEGKGGISHKHTKLQMMSKKRFRGRTEKYLLEWVVKVGAVHLTKTARTGQTSTWLPLF